MEKVEAAVLKRFCTRHILQSDKVLDNKKFASIYNLDENSPKTEDFLENSYKLVTRQTTGTSTTTMVDKNGKKLLLTFNSDGSGTKL